MGSPGRSAGAPYGNGGGNGPSGATGGETGGGSGIFRGKADPDGARQAERGKATICHATHSDTNPYVEITISRNALPAHDRHQDGEDLLEVPAGGCPGGSQVAEAGKGNGNGNGNVQPASGHDQGKVTICHATNSETNPFVLITVSNNALPAHTSHQDGEDIVNPTGPCPAGQAPAGSLPAAGGGGGPTVMAASPPTGTVASGPTAVAAPASTPSGDVQGVSAESDEFAASGPERFDADTPQGQVAGVSDESGDTSPASRSGGGDEAAVADDGDSLPFTGFEVLIVALFGLAALGVGLAARRGAADRAA